MKKEESKAWPTYIAEEHSGQGWSWRRRWWNPEIHNQVSLEPSLLEISSSSLILFSSSKTLADGLGYKMFVIVVDWLG